MRSKGVPGNRESEGSWKKIPGLTTEIKKVDMWVRLHNKAKPDSCMGDIFRNHSMVYTEKEHTSTWGEPADMWRLYESYCLLSANVI